MYLVKSLAGAYNHLLYQCQKLKAAGNLHDCWFFNGNINNVLEEKGDRHHIAHTEDIIDLLDISEDELTAIVKV